MHRQFERGANARRWKSRSLQVVPKTWCTKDSAEERSKRTILFPPTIYHLSPTSLERPDDELEGVDWLVSSENPPLVVHCCHFGHYLAGTASNIFSNMSFIKMCYFFSCYQRVLSKIKLICWFSTLLGQACKFFSDTTGNPSFGNYDKLGKITFLPLLIA